MKNPDAFTHRGFYFATYSIFQNKDFLESEG